jgi:hypothetical protein
MQILKTSLSVFLVTVLLLSCYEKKEGCLDVYASNFALDADLDCCENPDDCCCQYPELKLSIKHQYQGENLGPGKIYHTQHGQPFRLESLMFFICNVRLTDGPDYATSDTLLIVDQHGQTHPRPDDVEVVSTGKFSITVGTFNRPGIYNRLKFMVGLNEPERSAPSDQFDPGHPLALGQTHLKDTLSGEWLSYQLAWIPDTASQQVELLQVPANNLIEVELPVEIIKNAGSDITIPLAIDYQHWLGSIDLQSDDQTTKNRKILEHLAQSFSIL